MNKNDNFEKIIKIILTNPEVLENIKIGEDENKIYTKLGYIKKESEGKEWLNMI